MESFQTLSRGLVVSRNVNKYGSSVFAVSKSYRKLVVGPVLKMKTGFWGFETERNPGFRKCAEIW